MAKQSVLIYSVPLKILKEIVKAAPLRGRNGVSMFGGTGTYFQRSRKRGHKKGIVF